MIAMNPRTGEVLALHSAPSFDPNWFIGRLSDERYNELNTDPGKPLYNKVMQGRYPPASTFKLATAIIGMQNGVVKLNDRMPEPCRGGFMYGNRYFKCWEKRGHGDITLARAIEVSCDTYFYQLGIRIGLSRLLDGATAMKFRERTGIDLPGESAPQWPASRDYSTRSTGVDAGRKPSSQSVDRPGLERSTVTNMAGSTRRSRPAAWRCVRRS